MLHSRLFSLFFLAFSVWFAGCAPKVRTTLENRITNLAKPTAAPVLVLEQGQLRPADAQLLGFSRISDNGFSFNCTYPEVLELAKQETLKAGGNALQILKHTKPDSWSTCHRIEVAMLFIPNVENYQEVKPSSIPHPDLEEIKAKQKAIYESKAAANTDTSVSVFLEQQPEFPGGQNTMMKFLISSVKYPETAMRDNISGRVIGSFVVDENGEITDIKILKSVREDIDQEFIRVVMSMPAWIPGFQNGKAVKVKYTMPINFETNKPVKQKKNQNRK